MLASLYYMSNYSTKDDVKFHQLVMTASIFKSALEKATAAKENLTPQQLTLLKTKPTGEASLPWAQTRSFLFVRIHVTNRNLHTRHSPPILCEPSSTWHGDDGDIDEDILPNASWRIPRTSRMSAAGSLLLHHGHIGFIGSVRDRLEDDNDHHVYLIQQRSWCNVVIYAASFRLGRRNLLTDSGRRLQYNSSGTSSAVTPTLLGNAIYDPPPVSTSTTSTCDSVLESPRKRRLAQLSTVVPLPTASTVIALPTKILPKQEDSGEGGRRSRR
ncbi:hypothetical protein V8E54_000107 [Elaphomyces granulatus]